MKIKLQDYDLERVKRIAKLQGKVIFDESDPVHIWSVVNEALIGFEIELEFRQRKVEDNDIDL